MKRTILEAKPTQGRPKDGRTGGENDFLRKELRITPEDRRSPLRGILNRAEDRLRERAAGASSSRVSPAKSDRKKVDH